MKRISIISLLSCLMALTLNAQRPKLGAIKDANNWGIRVHHSNGTHTDYKGNGTSVAISAVSFCEVMGPFNLDANNSPLNLTESGDVAPGNYTVRKTNDKFQAIAYSGTNFTGNVTYLKLDQTYSNLYGTSSSQGIKSLKTGAKASYRQVGSGSTSGSWPFHKCVGDHANISPAAEDILVQMRKCASGLTLINP